MKRDAQTAILGACARFLRRGLEPIAKRLEDFEAKSLAPMSGRIAQLEKELAARPDVKSLVDAAVAALPAPANGKDADMDALRAFIAEQVKAIPVPKDGKSVTLEEVVPLIREEVRAEAATHVQAIPAPKDGKSVTLADVQPMLNDAIKAMRDEAAAAVDAAIKAIPVVKDGAPGKSITAEDIAPVLEMNVAKWALEFERRGNDAVQRVLDKIVQPKDGKPGRDGLGFDDLAVEYDGEKTITLKMQRGDVVKEANIVLPINIDRGIFKEGQTYTAGDSVTWGGSYWIAQRDTGAKPDSPDSGWRLAVKKGRDGKDGRNGIDKTAPVALKD